MPTLTLAHSPDPDDAFMWWPITGKIAPFAPGAHSSIPTAPPRGAREFDPAVLPPVLSPAVIDTGRFTYRAFPADIERLNRHASLPGKAHALFDITALSFRAYCDARSLYAITSCGSSFGDGFGPKVIERRDHSPARIAMSREAFLRHPRTRIAIPGRRTTAFLVLGMVLGEEALRDQSRFIEVPFEQVIPTVARGDAEAGLVIHEGQVLYEQAGLGLVLDLGVWWKSTTGLPLPLGANAVRRDLDERFGAGTMREVTRTLSASIRHALAHREEAIEYTLPFALANVLRSDGASPNQASATHGPASAQVDRYVAMYVNDWTLDMQERGREAVRRLLEQGHRLGLCPDPGAIDVIAD